MYKMIGRSKGLRTVAGALLLSLAAACSTDELLEVDLDVITPEAAASAAGAEALYNSVQRDIRYMMGSNVSMWSAVGTFTDELVNARPGWYVTDSRDITPDDVLFGIAWTYYNYTNYSGPRALRAMRQYMPDNADRARKIGHVQAIRALNAVVGGEAWCNGIPESILNDDGSTEFLSTLVSNADLFQRAVVLADSALASLPATDALRNFASIVKARAQLNLNQFAAAATTVAAVPTSYAYNLVYTASGTITLGPFDWIPNSSNFGVPNGKQASNKYAVDWNDPRIKPVFLRKGQDGVTDTYNPSAVTWMQAAGGNMPAATGVEARLIEAEANLRAGGTTWLTTLNQLRAASPYAAQLPALTDPGNAEDRETLLFSERAKFLYLTNHRLGDMRRRVRQFNRAVDDVFPSGPFAGGGLYGNSVSGMPTRSEMNTHPAFSAGCDVTIP